MLCWAREGGCWRTLACLGFEWTPPRVVIYCAVSEWWLTQEGPICRDIRVQVFCTQASAYCPRRARSCFGSLFGFTKAGRDCPAGCGGAAGVEQVSTHQLSRAGTPRAPLWSIPAVQSSPTARFGGCFLSGCCTRGQ